MNNKEEFCAACLAIPIALIGGAAAKSSYSASQSRKKNYTMMIISIVSFILALAIAVYYLCYKRCKICLDAPIF